MRPEIPYLFRERVIMVFFAGSIRLMVLQALVAAGVCAAGTAGAVECDLRDGLRDTGAATAREEYLVVVSDPLSKWSQTVAFYGRSEGDAAFSKCQQLAKVHRCSKVGSNRVEIYGYGEHIKEYQEIDLFGHTLQNSFAQFFRYSWSKINDCNKDLVGSIAAQLR
jgi:hypothetical protein